jgi:hypothetical protein
LQDAIKISGLPPNYISVRLLKRLDRYSKRKIGYPVGEIIRNYYKMQPLISAENSVTDEPFVTICRSMQAMSSRKRR